METCFSGIQDFLLGHYISLPPPNARPFATLPVAGHAEAAVNPGVSFTKELLDSPLTCWPGHLWVTETQTRLSQHSPRIAGRPGATTPELGPVSFTAGVLSPPSSLVTTSEVWPAAGPWAKRSNNQ